MEPILNQTFQRMLISYDPILTTQQYCGTFCASLVQQLNHSFAPLT